MGKRSPAEEPRPTLGERRVRLAFNPGGNELVTEIKRKSADLIDLCQKHKFDAGDKYTDMAEERRCWELAQDAYEAAAMWAVKAATA